MEKNSLSASEIISELKKADAVLEADNYKEWCYVRLSISQAIEYLSQKGQESDKGEIERLKKCIQGLLIGFKHYDTGILSTDDTWQMDFAAALETAKSLLASNEDNTPLDVEKLAEKAFTYFPNHGDEDGRGCYTICYAGKDEDGDFDFNGDEIIVGVLDEEKDAIESCRRLNEILNTAKETNK